MTTTRKTCVALGIFLLTVNSSVYAWTDEDETTAERAAKAFCQRYNEAGMQGLIVSIKECYERAQSLKTEDAALYCYTMDYLSSILDAAFAEEFGFPLTDQTKIANVNTRINELFDQLEYDDVMRGSKTAEWSSLAGKTFGEETNEGGDCNWGVGRDQRGRN